MNSLQRLSEADAIQRLAAHDGSLYTSDIDVRQKITHRLGWTDLAEKAPQRIPLIVTLGKTLVEEGATDIVLLGMGGSSLAALVMSQIIGSAPGMPRLHVLDTTNPLVIDRALHTLDRASTYFLISSKSGTTIEPLSLYAIFRAWMEEKFPRPQAGKHFIAITDPGSALEKLRTRDLMRLTLNTPPSVGGRFSALTLFGLTPAALIGIDVAEMCSRAQEMERRCHADTPDNPGAVLAAFLGDAHAAGRDKLTLVTCDDLRPFGLWVEQLVAESTGKEGTGLVPVIEHDATTPPDFGPDRVVVVMRHRHDDALRRWAGMLADKHPVIELELDDPLDIGAEFVRWEHAIALLGLLMGINPFDEPNVAEAKAATTSMLTGDLSAPQAIADHNGIWTTFSGSLADSPPPAELTATASTILESLQPGDYLATLAYLPEEGELMAHLRTALKRVSSAMKIATCLETGPRYLHSTGQLHKGGPTNGVFLVITARERGDIEIPGHSFTLNRLFRAQAEGDIHTLAAHGLRVARLDLPAADARSVASVAAALVAAARFQA